MSHSSVDRKHYSDLVSESMPWDIATPDRTICVVAVPEVTAAIVGNEAIVGYVVFDIALKIAVVISAVVGTLHLQRVRC